MRLPSACASGFQAVAFSECRNAVRRREFGSFTEPSQTSESPRHEPSECSSWTKNSVSFSSRFGLPKMGFYREARSCTIRTSAGNFQSEYHPATGCHRSAPAEACEPLASYAAAQGKPKGCQLCSAHKLPSNRMSTRRRSVLLHVLMARLHPYQ